MSLHLIDSEGHLVSEKHLQEYLTSLVTVDSGKGAARNKVLRAVGVNYHVVGVFGGQSSGKSTLLNYLFDTHFQTLDERVRRGQTTLGAFLSFANTELEGFTGDASAGFEAVAAAEGGDREIDTSARLQAAAAAAAAETTTESPSSKSLLLVVDFEGTDGLERGENQSFERQLSLFGLCLADTLIVNMWAVDVGRFNAANLSLLRTIFEVNLQLFSHETYEPEEKPTLLIVLRDFTEEDVRPSLATVRKSFDTIWENITRPSQFAESTIDSLFCLKYYVMPHFKLQRKEFEESAVTLRHWFGDTRSPDYLFKHQAMFREVPLEGLPAYVTNCWEAIRSSKDLDIPTQREMLAKHRCSQAKEQELSNFFIFCKHYEDRVNRGEMLLRLSEVLDEEMDARLTDYYKQTTLYNKDVRDAFARELEEELVSATMRVVSGLCKAMANEVLSTMETRVQVLVDSNVRQFLKAAQSLPLKSVEGSHDESSAPVAGERVHDELSEPTFAPQHAQQYQMDDAGCQRLVRKFWKNMQRALQEALGGLAVNPPAPHLYGRYTALIAEDPTARQSVINMVTDAIFSKVRSRIGSMAESASETMHRGFEYCLMHKADGTVQFFATTKGLMSAVPQAQQAGLALLSCLLYFRLDLVHPGTSEDQSQSAARGDGGAAASCVSRSACRVARERKGIVLRDSPADNDFVLGYTTLDVAPRYPLDVPVALNSGNATTEAPNSNVDDDGMVSSDCILLSEQAVQRICELYAKQCDFTTQLQLRTLEASKQRMPAWVIPALFILGWNEMWYVLTSPVLLAFIVVIGFVFFQNFIVAQWQAFEETGPTSVVVVLQGVFRHVGKVYRDLRGTGHAPSAGHLAMDATEMESRPPRMSVPGSPAGSQPIAVEPAHAQQPGVRRRRVDPTSE